MLFGVKYIGDNYFRKNKRFKKSVYLIAEKIFMSQALLIVRP